MAEADIKLDGECTIIEGGVLKVKAYDMELDCAERRHPGSTAGRRRALVHSPEDGLVLNWAKDYPGGTTVHGNLQVGAANQASDLSLVGKDGKQRVYISPEGQIYLGGEGKSGSLQLKHSQGGTKVLLKAGTAGGELLLGGEFGGDGGPNDGIVEITVRNPSSNARNGVSLSVASYKAEPWPAWPSETQAPSNLDLIAEMRKMKKEILKLREDVAALKRK